MSRSTETSAVHAGREDLAERGVHAPPLDLSTTYPLPSLAVGRDSLAALAAGDAEAENPVYARLHNETVARWERGIAELEGADQAVAFGSGMAAVTATLMALRLRDAEEGRNRGRVVAVRPLYGGTDHLLATGLLGFDVTWTTEEDLPAALGDDVAAVVVESPANPTLQLADLAAIARAAGDVPVLVDNTFATPVLQNPLAHGAAFALHSATKFLGGHGDAMGGVVACSETWARRLRQVRILTGALLHPMGAWLLHRSLPTLPMRVERAQESARVLAARLQAHPAVERVHYPGLDDPRGLVGRQMRGAGAVLAFELAGGAEAAAEVMEAVRLITPAVSLGSTDTLIEHPAGLTHQIVGEGGRDEGGIGAGLLRLSVGLERADELWEDLARALAGSGRASGPQRAAG